MSTYFISDLHLEIPHSNATRIFLNFLNNKAIDADAVYILGDLFTLWLGDDDNSRLAILIKKALKQLTTQGIKTYFMHGNRDFLIGKKFAADTGITLLTDPTTVTIYGKKMLLMHGDLLCIDDIKYQAFCRKVHSKTFQTRILCMPLWSRRLLALFARYRSKRHTRITDLAIQDVNQDEVQRYLKRHGTNLLIHGHTHRPATHQLMINNKPAQRIVLAAWHDYGYALQIQPDGSMMTITLRPA